MQLSRASTVTGQLFGSQTTPQTNVNLSAEGTADWAHWGLTSANSFNHKSGVTQQISNFAPLGTGTIQQYTENPNAYSWGGGTPTATASNIDTGVYTIGANNGFQITVPADTTQRTLKLYVGVSAATGRLDASLSDGSAPTYIDTGLVNTTATSNAVYTLNYQAGASGQTLTVKWTVQTAHSIWGNATLQAASLVSTAAADNSEPTVSITGLRHYARVSNQVPVAVQANDNLGISRVELYADSALLSTNNVVPNVPNALVTFNWNTTTLSNGKHSLQAKAFDAAGNSKTVTVVILTLNAPTSLPIPTAAFTAMPSSISAGQSATLSWTTTDATSATINQALGSVALNGSVVVSPSANTTYSLTATNASGTVTRTANVTVVPPVGNNISLLAATIYQTMDGWEITDQAGQLFSSAWGNYQNSLLDQAVNDLGINRVRVEINSGIENPTDYFTQWRAGQITESQYNATRYEIINDDSNPNTINANGFKWAVLDHSIDNVVLPLRQRLQARGESLWVNVNYLDFGSSAFEHKNSPAEYAEFVLATYQHMQNRNGFVPNSWEVSLEPDTPSASWSATQVAQVIKVAGDLLAAHSFTPNFVAPSTTDAANAAAYIDQIALTPGAMQYVNEFSYHRYAGGTSTVLQSIASRAVTHNKKSSMLEWIGADYNTLHQDIKTGRISSWQQYTLAFPNQPDNGAQYYLVDDANPNNPIISLGSRTKFLRQYFRFIRSGAQRIEALTGNTNFDPVAFINTNGKYVVVVKAATSGTFSIHGLPAGTYGIKYTTASQYDVNSADMTITAGQALPTNIPGPGVITVYAR